MNASNLIEYFQSNSTAENVGAAVGFISVASLISFMFYSWGGKGKGF